MAVTRIQIAKDDIIKLFDNLPARVFRRLEFAEILNQYRRFWRLAQRTTTSAFIDFLVEQAALKVMRFNFPSRRETRYVWRSAPTLEIIQSLREGAYFSHYTAVSLHHLTEAIPKTMYLNSEQPPKRWGPGQLEQSRIDAAFRRPARISKNVARYGDLRVCLLSGMFTGNLGVTDFKGPEGEKIRVTDIERTLIDIVVRPFYSGGVFEVLSAYRNAASKISGNKLATMLNHLSYVYPYHQCIGFLMEKSGCYKPSDVVQLRRFEMEYDFYLTHQMGQTDYSKKWRLFFPKGL